jgi:hypothetical protein
MGEGGEYEVKLTNEKGDEYTKKLADITQTEMNKLLEEQKTLVASGGDYIALNELIKRLNGGVVDTHFPVNWQHYRNCILLTQHNEIKQLNTKIFKIIEL